MKDKAYKLGLTVPQYVQLRQKYYRRKHSAEILTILYIGFIVGGIVVFIGYGIILTLTS